MNLNRSEELVEDDRDDELMMDTTLKIGLKNIKGGLLNCSSSKPWMDEDDDDGKTTTETGQPIPFRHQFRPSKDTPGMPDWSPHCLQPRPN